MNLDINLNKVVIVLRSCSGAGKSTLAEFLTQNYKRYDYSICSADDYFMIKREYCFNAKQLGLAHNYCFEKFKESVEYGIKLIVLSNTNTSEKELKPYLDLAAKYQYTVFSLVVENRHGNKNVHNVPEETLKRQENKLRNSIKLI